MQKRNDQAWRGEVEEIYKNYSIYHQGNGLEQVIFQNGPGLFKNRSFQIISKLKEYGFLSNTGKLLDIGCGNGGFLKSFQELFPNWVNSGYEIDEKYKENVLSIPNVVNFYSSDLSIIKEKFDVITLIHVLEHLSDPWDYLNKVKDLLLPDGILLIEVPNFRENPFDLIIADHIVHYSLDTFNLIVNKLGGEIVYQSENIVHREITICVSFSNLLKEKSKSEKVPPEVKNLNLVITNEYIYNLEKFANTIVAESKTGVSLGIFGTSIAATWVLSVLGGESISYFVDEDINRIGRRIFDIPILSPENVSADSILVLPFKKEIASSIFHRLFLNKKINYLSPEF
ncbi:class I SAM-dependent methyltransferase [Leptospira borgpetersenii serovar Ballum]|nr:methyltransferase domain protein [Leptospira borgpetersenii serovar Castellonis str. 200801910]EMK08805.1 methyltransferase domain protein [Leptospira sp. serovar Kenya str. Sh9]EMO08144.1 methyltransferase domain protein [Leptospira borgpetersenii str. Noumea 25]KGE24535.1 methyltransferase [Leptospira borgpetersenii serovar Ballum]MBF3372378.1 class I SAM-dependent methyltransferase [Leptospira borgpetersenii serovar Arborea]QHE28530.1 methyltransferase domain-containing protein [Leptospi